MALKVLRATGGRAAGEFGLIQSVEAWIKCLLH